jgi:uncharacterized membrane protein
MKVTWALCMLLRFVAVEASNTLPTPIGLNGVEDEKASNQSEDLNGERDLTYLSCVTLPTDRYYHIISKNSNMAVNIDQASTANGASLIQWPKSPERNDNWRFQSVGYGYYQIISEHSQKGVNGRFRGQQQDIVLFITLNLIVCRDRRCKLQYLEVVKQMEAQLFNGMYRNEKKMIGALLIKVKDIMLSIIVSA